MIKTDRKLSQLMMRARVVAQGCTVAALVVGFAYAATQGDGKQS